MLHDKIVIDEEFKSWNDLKWEATRFNLPAGYYVGNWQEAQLFSGLAMAIRCFLEQNWNYWSKIASAVQSTTQVNSGWTWLSLFQRERHVVFFGSIKSRRRTASACPSAKTKSVR